MVIDVVQISSTVMITDGGPVTGNPFKHYSSHSIIALPTTVSVPTLLTIEPLILTITHWYDDWLCILFTGPTNSLLLGALLYPLDRSADHSRPLMRRCAISTPSRVTLLVTLPSSPLETILQSGTTCRGLAPENPQLNFALALMHTVAFCGPLIITGPMHVHIQL